MAKRIIYHFLSDDDLLRISYKIKEMEKISSGEICVSVKEGLNLFNRRKSVRELAEKEFFKLGIQNTRDKTGILIFIILKSRKFFILADSGINEKVDPNTWDSVKDEMQMMFLKGEFCKGILLGVDEVGRILGKHFPIKPDDTNELSNRVRIEQ